MENASKALLIAGSVLIVILLIAMGMKVFNSTKGTTDSVDTTMNATEVAMFNNKFMSYIGNKKTANEAKALLNLVISNNSINTKKVCVRFINNSNTNDNVYTTDSIQNLSKIISNVSELSSKTFKISIGMYNSNNQGILSSGYENGYIKYILIETV